MEEQRNDDRPWDNMRVTKCSHEIMKRDREEV